MLTNAQRERIICHLQRGWKLPDSLIHDLWEAYEALEEAQTGMSARPESEAGRPQLPRERNQGNERRI
jgi:hypothetical protein